MKHRISKLLMVMMMAVMLVAGSGAAMAEEHEGDIPLWLLLAALGEDLGFEVLDLDFEDGNFEEAEFGGYVDNTPVTFEVGPDGEVTDFEWNEPWQE